MSEDLIQSVDFKQLNEAWKNENRDHEPMLVPMTR